ncbi:OPT oligopeptide transporter protein-domain-containing protein [Cokeromyces recurvatus]|uniref:OPT oligopeptide transporter protein-domain-containing protein n=1 Tax=Cokeromyces recurvatus TaxID=90255 RepID=UPI00221EF8B1|nr:OPT oligopeptide transporter protein-domain-containing protein [Cokeromyces recurvatus]KAI7907391.1 OPT oligopeptide transporter protein-domain-containing protein [Cokeromyces recurvatus]
MYFGLQTGWISMMSLQASLLGFAVFKSALCRCFISSGVSSTFSPKENVYLQTVAVATATMPLAAGFVGIIPALDQLTEDDSLFSLSPLKLILWSLGLSFFGVFFAVPLRKQTIVKEKLKFPSGTATAEMIYVLHNQFRNEESRQNLIRRRRNFNSDIQEYNDDWNSREEGNRIELFSLEMSNQQQQDESFHSQIWHLKLKALLVSFSVSSIYTLASYFFPIIYALPIFNWLTLNTIDFKAWEWYFTPSLSYVGQGIIMGFPTTLSMLLGCFIGWGILSPVAYFSGWAPGPVNDWKTGSKGWILWSSLSIMISESIVSLFIAFIKQIISLFNKRQTMQNTVYNKMNEKEETDLLSEYQVPLYIVLLGLILSTLLCMLMVQIVFGNDIMPIGMTFVSILFALFLSILGVRALGETDLNPVSGIGKVSQLLFAALMPGSIIANIIAGGIAEAGAQQAGDLMQDLKTGYLLKASPRAQFYGQLIGSLVSSFIATAAYILYKSVYTIPGPEFPAPTAQVWIDMAQLVNGHSLPPHAFEFMVLFSIVFGVLTVVKEIGPLKWRLFIPHGIAFAIGIYNPPSFTLARVIGGYLYTVWSHYCDSETKSFLDSWYRPYKAIGKIAIIIVASGFVLGEGTFAIINMILYAFHVHHF